MKAVYRVVATFIMNGSNRHIFINLVILNFKDLLLSKKMNLILNQEKNPHFRSLSRKCSLYKHPMSILAELRVMKTSVPILSFQNKYICIQCYSDVRMLKRSPAERKCRLASTYRIPCQCLPGEDQIGDIGWHGDDEVHCVGVDHPIPHVEEFSCQACEAATRKGHVRPRAIETQFIITNPIGGLFSY